MRHLQILTISAITAVFMGISSIGNKGVAASFRWDVNDGGNGHLYEAFLVPNGITWTEARIASESLGDGWHLASITSPEENQFVTNLWVDNPAFSNCCRSSNSTGPWLGAFASSNNSNDWQWVTGEPFQFTNWGPLEPFGNGDRIAYFGFQNALANASWNDMPDGGFLGLQPLGYIAENSKPVPLSETASIVPALAMLALLSWKYGNKK